MKWVLRAAFFSIFYIAVPLRGFYGMLLGRKTNIVTHTKTLNWRKVLFYCSRGKEIEGAGTAHQAADQIRKETKPKRLYFNVVL